MLAIFGNIRISRQVQQADLMKWKIQLAYVNSPGASMSSVNCQKNTQYKGQIVSMAQATQPNTSAKTPAWCFTEARLAHSATLSFHCVEYLYICFSALCLFVSHTVAYPSAF